MKTVLISLTAILIASLSLEAQDKDTLLTLFWNIENFFDHIDQGTGDSDKEFSSMGARHWTKKKFYRKCDAISKSILWIGERCGRMPDVIGFAEVENREVIIKLLENTLLRKYDYDIVHYDSGDRRGIDVALIYRKSVFKKISSSLMVPEYDGVKMQTRDILQVCLENSSGECYDFIVNHHPSKFSGAKESEEKRNAAMTALKLMCDSLASVSGRPIIAMGDFNDNPYASSFDIIEGTLINKGKDLQEEGEGSIRYEGKWDLIDMFLVSSDIEKYTRMEVCTVPFLMTWEKKHPGEKPLRTYSGPRYIGGVSDHCPVILWYFNMNY